MTSSGSRPDSPPLAWTWLGRAPYRPVWDLQEQLRARIVAGDDGAERVLLVEHDPVVTLGRNADEAHLLLPGPALAARGVDVVRTNRGGDVTYHGPGQLVIYPVVRLRAGLVAHVELVGRALVEELASLGVAARWQRDPAGVWVGEAKVAACGVHVRHGVAIHGFALNVRAEALDGFRAIVPCGLAGVRVTCVAAERAGDPPSLEDLAARIARRVCRAWGREPVCACDHDLAR